VHGVDVAIAEAPRQPEVPHLQADIILTDKPGITLMMRFADCVPILLHDLSARWWGLPMPVGWAQYAELSRAAVEAMQTRFGSKPADIQAGIGPSIGPDHYQVGLDVVTQVRQAFGSDEAGLLAVCDGSMFLICGSQPPVT